MKRLRRVARVIPKWSALALLLLTSHAISSANVEGSRAQIALSDDGTRMQVRDSNGEAVFEFTIDEWRRWAEENLRSALGQPVRIGEQVMPVESFDRFGAAVLSPSQERLALTTSTYAMLTTVSIVTILDLTGITLEVVSEPAFGSVEEMVWSPCGDFIAYSLGTARASGDGLRIDDVSSLVPVVSLAGEDLLEAAARKGQTVEADGNEWLPEFRNLRWSEPRRLEFDSNDVLNAGRGAMRWSISTDHGKLKIE